MEKLAKLLLMVGSLSLSSCGLHGNAMDSLFAEETSTSEKYYYPRKSSSEEESSQASSRAVYSGNYDKVDVDISVYSETAALTEAWYIADHIEDYRGKTMKVKGQFNVYSSNWEGYYFYACTVMDSTLCCTQDFEFVLREKRKYPQEFPAEGTIITVAGVFDPYTEENEGKTYVYCNLVDAVIF